MSNALSINFTPNDIPHLISDILQEAKRQGATSAEVDVGMNKGYTVSVRKGEVESIEYNRDKGVDIAVYFGKRSGTASLSDVGPDAIKKAVEAACHIAKFTDEDDCSGLAEKEILAFNYPDLNLAHHWNLSVEHAIELAKECEAKALAKDKRITNSEGVSLTTVDVWHGYGNTHGFIGTCPMSRHEMSCVLIAKEGDDMQRDFYYTVATDPARLESITTIANYAALRTVQRLGAKRLPTQQCPVIFRAEEARSLFGYFVSAISGGNLYRKSSFLLDHLGKEIFPNHIELHEEPHRLNTLGSSPFDGDGVATRPNVFIENGILKQYALGVYSARKLGLKTTGNGSGVHNFIVKTGKEDLKALLKTMNKGLLVTELMGQGVNIVTGDYSRGATGFWIENGEIQYPVHEITIAGNLKEMFKNLIAIGNDIDTRGNILTGSVLLENMTIAGE